MALSTAAYKQASSNMTKRFKKCITKRLPTHFSILSVFDANPMSHQEPTSDHGREDHHPVKACNKLSKGDLHC